MILRLICICSVLFLLSQATLASHKIHSYSTGPSGSIKGTVRATAAGGNGEAATVDSAELVLTNVNIPTFLLRTVTDSTGAFVFENLPAGKYKLVVTANGLPTAQREIDLSAGANLVIDINLTLSVSESVTVRNEEGLLSTSETTTSNIVRTETLKTQPFREDEFQSALPLTPGVVTDSAHKAYVKGTRSGQSNYTVNGAEVTDPVSGEPAFEIPLEAVANIQVEEDPYSAEFGRFTGGVTNLQSKGGSDKFNVSVARFFPTLHNFFSTKIDSFRPRVTFSGPVIKGRLHFLQSFEYRYRRDYVPNLEKPLNYTATERLSSFTQFDLQINKNNQLKFNFALFPQKVRFFGLNTFEPAAVSSNLKERGYLASLSEVSVFKDTSFLASAVSYKTADLDVIPQGELPMTIVSDIYRGNYFAGSRRGTSRFQWQETYYFRPFEALGKHSLKVGFDFNRTKISHLFQYRSIFLRRLDGTLAQSVDFTSPARRNFAFTDIGGFVQDRLILNKDLTLDFGVRFDRDGVSRTDNVAPRFSFLWSLSKKTRTVVRGGVGIFYDNTLPIAGYYCDNCNDTATTFGLSSVPERTVTNFASDGITVLDGPRFFVDQIVGDILSPRSVRWSLHLDQGITKNLTLRFGYLQRRSNHDLIVETASSGANLGINSLSSSGRSQYREFQILAAYSSERYGNWNISYTNSKAKGDLNNADTLVGDFPAYVIRPNQFSILPFDAPHRFLAYSQFELPHDIRVAPLFEYRTGYPFSAVDDSLNFVGVRNRAGRFPNYLSLDIQISKGFPVSFRKKSYRLRPGVALFNVTNHFNPRDIQANVNNPNFEKLYNSLGFGVKAKFDIDL